MPRYLAWLLAAVTLAGPGCASLSQYRARSTQLHAELDRHRYGQPLELVWPQVQRLLADRGLALAGKDAAAIGQKPGYLAQFSSAARETRSTPTGGMVLETGWNQDGLRWRAEATPEAEGLRLVLTRIARSQDEFGRDGVTLRDHELELDLLRRVDPEAADRIDELVEPTTPASRPPDPAGAR